MVKVRIGVAESSKLVEVDVEDIKKFKAGLESAVAEGRVSWVTDVKGKEVGIPAGKIAYVEVESDESERAVGFAPAV